MTPRNQSKSFAVNYADELLRIAKGDLESAEILNASNKGRIENAFFFIHQSIEKCLKAILIKANVEVPLVHYLGILVAKIPDNLAFPHGYELSELNQFASVRRYEEGAVVLSSDEALVVIKTAHSILDWAQKFR